MKLAQVCCFYVRIQHRYYGKSMPFGKDSYKSAKTLGYLTSQQALADFAVLIRSLKQNLSSEASPVVVFGGSYGGSKFLNYRKLNVYLFTPANLRVLLYMSPTLCYV